MNLHSIRAYMNLKDNVKSTAKEKKQASLKLLISFTFSVSALASIPVYNTIQKLKYKDVELQLFEKNYMGVPYTIMHVGKTHHFAISDAFTLEEQQQLVSAIETYDFMAKGLNFDYTITNQFGTKTISIRKNTEDLNLTSGMRTLAYAHTKYSPFYAKIMETASIYINPCYEDSTATLEEIALHEIGHIIGLKDVTDPALEYLTMMYYNAKYSPKALTELDKKEVNIVYPPKDAQPQNATSLSALKEEKKEEEIDENYYTIG